MRYSWLLILLFFSTAKSQVCNCPKQFLYITNSLKNDYVAYEDVINKKGKDKFQHFEQKQFKKAGKATNEFECAKVLKELIRYFNEPHLNLVLKSDSSTTKIFSELFKTFPAEPLNEDSLKKALQLRKTDIIEGIWELTGSGYYRVAIIKKGKKYDAVILETNSLLWFKGQKKIELFPEKNDIRTGNAFFWGRDHIPEMVGYQLSGNVINFIGYGYFKKIFPNDLSEKASSFKTDRKFEFKQITQHVSYLALPSFDIRYADTISRILNDAKTIINKTDFLIVDLRDNGGGFSYVYSPLLPYIYTGPVSKPAFYMKASLNNSILYEKYIVNKFNDSSNLIVLNKLKQYTGRLVKIRDADTIKFDEVKPKPVRVIFLVNKNTASAAEDLLLVARQSSKVVLAGQNTRGAFDHRDVLGARDIESAHYNFFCPVGKNIGRERIDNVGIRPNLIISLHVEDWVQFVVDHLINAK